MNNICSLADLKTGQSGIVTAMNVKGAIRRRLQDIGLIEGSYVCCELTSPGGNPSAYRIKGAVIAIRNEDCRDITIALKNNREVM